MNQLFLRMGYRKPYNDNIKNDQAMNIIVKLAKGMTPTEEDLTDALWDICDDVHSSCDFRCPVFDMNGGKIPSKDGHQWNCSCFKNGTAMLKFIREH